MKKVMITGGAGFMGANFAEHFLRKGYKVVLFDNLSRKGSLENLSWLRNRQNAENLSLVVGDVRIPPGKIAEEIESCDAIFHFAAQVAVTSSVADPSYDFEVNALGTLKMLELVRQSSGKKPVFFLASTNKVYGATEEVKVVEGAESYSYAEFPEGLSEDMGLDFHSPYGCSKGCADQYARDYFRIYGLRSVVFRQSCIYGYRQFGIEDQGWVAWFTIAALLGRPITIYGDGKQVRDVLFIDDLINAYEKVWDRVETTRGKVYNVGGGPSNAISLRQLIRFLEEQLKVKLNLSYSTWRPGDQLIYVSNIDRCAEDFDWRPVTGWEAGVHKLVKWVQDNRSLLRKLF